MCGWREEYVNMFASLFLKWTIRIHNVQFAINSPISTTRILEHTLHSISNATYNVYVYSLIAMLIPFSTVRDKLQCIYIAFCCWIYSQNEFRIVTVLITVNDEHVNATQILSQYSFNEEWIHFKCFWDKDEISVNISVCIPKPPASTTEFQLNENWLRSCIFLCIFLM